MTEEKNLSNEERIATITSKQSLRLSFFELDIKDDGVHNVEPVLFMFGTGSTITLMSPQVAINLLKDEKISSGICVRSACFDSPHGFIDMDKVW